MSRQHGKRPRSTSNRSRPAAPSRPVEVAATEEGVPAPRPLRTWTAVAGATVVLMFSSVGLLLFVVALADRADGLDVANSAISTPLTFALILIPVLYAILAYGSRHPRPAAAVLRATLLAPLAVVVFFLARDPVSAAVAGFGAGGIVALRPVPEVGLRPRIWAVLLVTVYAAVLAYVLPLASLSVLAVVLPSLVMADTMALRRLERRAELTADRRE